MAYDMRNLQNSVQADFPRAQVLPTPSGLKFLLDGHELAGYHFGHGLPKPFIYPLKGHSGADLTRLGHPNPQSNHDHHRSIWFGHQFVRPIEMEKGQKPATAVEWNFWEEPKPISDIKIRHSKVLALEDGSEFAAAAVEANWWAGGRSLIKQTTVYAIAPMADGGHALDIQTELACLDGRMIELGKTNFGLLGVRVAKSMSEQFGGGRLLNSEGRTGEPEIFAKPARWVDYSGPTGPGRVEGICYMDHASNPRHPVSWHVRRDGWMEAAFTMADAWRIAADHPLTLRYRLLAHSGKSTLESLNQAWLEFNKTKPYQISQPKGQIPIVMR
ncbi:MAG: hypothetical protein DWI28_02455 [Planctomycetota bacterium]|nr:MAG: hypothetical protein DWI28_02455 [Planctomycetota bacterium]